LRPQRLPGASAVILLHEKCDVARADGAVIGEAVPCEVSPINSIDQQVMTTSSVVITHYRIIMRRDVMQHDSTVTWRGDDYQIEGDVETHALRGRLHHFEAILKRVGA
ncbi:MAG TPA: hypothetical protein VFL99_15110, partial [Segeticoccus sp.]|uniref:hypothetical protein n=1 Tax=Segeticoccus sp. TaxID=2706531 RepID=UPI002D80AD5E